MAERRPRDERLERVHGTAALFSTAYGNVGSTFYYALGLVAAFALGLTPIVYLISGAIFVCTAATYTEATVMYPEAGGSASFARHAFNEMVSFVAAWGQMFNYIITISISAFFVPHYMSVFWGPLNSSPYDVLFGVLVVGLLAVVNIVGSRESAGLNLVLALIDMASQALIVVLGLVLVLSPSTLVANVDLGVAPTWGNFILGVAVGMIAYTGIETLSNMAEETKDAAKVIPRAAGLVVLVVLGMFFLIAVIALSAMPVTQSDGTFTTELATTYESNPALGIVANLPLGALGGLIRVYIGVLAVTILIIATNAGLIGLSRLTYSMGQYRQLPGVVRRIHPKYRTPYVAIGIFGVVAALTMLPGEVKLLGTLYAFGAMLSFTVAHVSLIGLRRRYPDRERQWRSPINFRIRGVSVPLLAVVGGLGTFGAWITVLIRDTRTLVLGFIWLTIGAVLYIAYRRRQALSLTGTVKVKMLEPVVEREVEYNSVLVVFEDLRYSPEAVVTAAKLAARRRRGIHVLITITVPLHLPLTASLEKQERDAASILESARLAGGRRVTGEWIKVRAGEAGSRVVGEAGEIKAEAIVMPISKRRTGPVFGKTLETILTERPCRVIITSESQSSARRGAG